MGGSPENTAPRLIEKSQFASIEVPESELGFDGIPPGSQTRFVKEPCGIPGCIRPDVVFRQWHSPAERVDPSNWADAATLRSIVGPVAFHGAASMDGRNSSASSQQLLSLTGGDRHGPTDDPAGQGQGSQDTS